MAELIYLHLNLGLDAPELNFGCRMSPTGLWLDVGEQDYIGSISRPSRVLRDRRALPFALAAMNEQG